MDANVSLRKRRHISEKKDCKRWNVEKESRVSDRTRLYSVLSFPSGHAYLNYGSCEDLFTVDAGPDLQVINLMVFAFDDI